MRIELSRNQEVFFSGQAIEGVLFLSEADEALKAGVSVSISLVTFSRVTAFAKTKSSIAVLSKLVRTGTATQAAVDFGFTAQPVPSTYIHSNGHVLTVIIATVSQSNASAVKPITVLPVIDANAPRFAVQSFRQDDVPGFHCGWLCGIAAPMTTRLTLPRVACCPGEHVAFCLRLASHSISGRGGASRFGNAVCSIRQLVRFLAPSPTPDVASPSTTEIENIVVQEPVDMSRAAELSGKVFETVTQVRLPPCCPSIAVAASQLIEVCYFAVLTVSSVASEESGSSSSSSFSGTELRVPITVATAPHRAPDADPRMFSPAGVAAAAARSGESLKQRSTVIVPPTHTTSVDDILETIEPTKLEPFVKYIWFPVDPEPVDSSGSSLSKPLLSGAAPSASPAPAVQQQEGDYCFFCPPGELAPLR